MAMRNSRGVDPSDFSDDSNSADVRNINVSGDIVTVLANMGNDVDSIIDELYAAGMPADYVDTVLSELEHRNGSWN